MCARVMDEGSCEGGGVARAEGNITSGEMRGCQGKEDQGMRRWRKGRPSAEGGESRQS